MRGVAPEEIRNNPDFDKEEYKRLYGRVIHKSFYSFDHHTPKYLIATCYDDCGNPFNKKSAIGQSLRLKIRAGGQGSLRVKINTDSERNLIHTIRLFPSEGIDTCYEASVSSISIAEKAHLFGEKQVVIEAENYCSPIAFHSLAFRYLTQEKLKKG